MKKLTLLLTLFLIGSMSLQARSSIIVHEPEIVAYALYAMTGLATLFIFLQYRFVQDKAYLHYCLYLFFNLAYFLNWHIRHIHDFGWMQYKEIIVLAELLVVPLLIWGYIQYFLFVIAFFDLESKHSLLAKWMKRNYRVLRYLLIFDVLLFVLFELVLDFKEGYRLFRGGILGIVILISFYGIFQLLRLKGQLMKLIISGTLVYLIGSTFGFLLSTPDFLAFETSSLFKKLAILPTKLGLVSEFIIFSVGLAIRFKQLSEERDSLLEREKEKTLKKSIPDWENEEIQEHLPLFLKRLNRILQEELEKEDKDFSVRNISALMRMSRNNLNKRMKESASVKAQVYIRRFRLNEARRLMVEEHLTVKEVAHRVGYNEQANFSRAFKKEFGYPPSDLKK